MNFETKPVLDQSAYFWFDEANKEGIEFYGADTGEWMRFDLASKRAFSAAQRKILEDGITDEEDKKIEHTATATQAWRKFLPKVFKSANNITLADAEVTTDNCAELFNAMTQLQIIQCGNFVSSQESFLGKQQAD